MNNLEIIYRISDGSHKKNKLANATKRDCLKNALDIFKGVDFWVIADNCGAETLEWLEQLSGVTLVAKTSLGNSGTFRCALQFALDHFDDEAAVYFLEDDYLHRPAAPQAIMEGLAISDYVTLYDHPDKYINHSEGGPNPFIQGGGESTRVLLTASSHWKFTNSTTMTFAARVRTLREDRDVWMHFTSEKVPMDFFAFCHLLDQKRRRLVSPIPGLSTHAELAFLTPLVDWSSI